MFQARSTDTCLQIKDGILRDAFNHIDDNKDGHISAREVMLASYGPAVERVCDSSASFFAI